MKCVKVIVGQGSCGVATGAKKTAAQFERLIEEKDLDVKVDITGCVGTCYLEPIVDVYDDNNNMTRYVKVNADKDSEIVEKHLVNGEVVTDLALHDEDKLFIEKQQRVVLRHCGLINPEKIEEYIAVGGYAATKKVVTSMTQDEVIEEIKVSGLRGRGGAGFPTWFKWNAAKQNHADQKYIVCNADEGDPGAYMDRSTLEGDPHSVLEAMTICGRAIGAHQGFIYIRAEYPLAIHRLEIAMKQAREYGLLGKNILGSGFDYDIEIRLGAGAFVCGEETALLQSIEGHRGMPLPRPPFPAVKGLWGKPTVINNVETWANIPVIIAKGGAEFAKIGTPDSRGTKVFALTGKVKNSGLVEVPMGTTLREIVFDIGGGIANGKKFKAVQTGGPSGGVITEENLDTPIDFGGLQRIGSMMGSGGMIVMDEDDCIVDVAKFYLNFTVDESCGKCFPCRIGGKSLYNILDKITLGNGTEDDIDQLKQISLAMQKGSLCALGQTAPNPVLSTLRYFPEEYEAHIKEKRCPSGKCKKLIRYTIDPQKCIGCTACSRKCPVGAITGELKKTHSINTSVCIKCGVCKQTCKFGAISIE